MCWRLCIRPGRDERDTSTDPRTLDRRRASAYAGDPAGWKNDTDGVLDYVDEAECDQEKEFATLKAARSWATRNRRRDLWSQPDLVVLEYPDAGRRDQDATSVQHERYIGDGCGWESVQA
ncbi:hypothetical protein GALL_493920 [mine drainage metagenome]|uniref:Uncharacterized protein n=1 Tax=mine drainage metagenome TaxID=410659 RepID=A0A1J5PZH1_9ZZZZ